MKKKIVTGMAIAIILLLAGCDAVGNENIDNTITNVPNGKDNPDPDPDARLSVEIPEEAFSDPDYVWVREFAQEFLEFLKEPYRPPLSLSSEDYNPEDSHPMWFRVYGDIETFDRERAAWEKQNITRYNWSWERGLRTFADGDRTIVEERRFDKNYTLSFSRRQSLPSYWHPISIGNEIILPGVPDESYQHSGPGSYVPWRPFEVGMVSSVYDLINAEIEVLTLRNGWRPGHHLSASEAAAATRYRVGFKIDYDPVYHYPQRILWIQWCPDWITNHPDPLYKYPKLVYGIVKVLSFEPLESEPTPSDGKEVLPLEPETKQEY